MIGFMMFLHAAVAVFLIVIILMQSGRGGGLTEGFASAESIFGAKTNEFMIKATTVFAAVFLVTCLGLAVLSAQKSKSLMSGEVVPEAQIPIAGAVETVAKEANEQLEVIEDKTTAGSSAKVPTEVILEDAPVVATP